MKHYFNKCVNNIKSNIKKTAYKSSNNIKRKCKYSSQNGIFNIFNTFQNIYPQECTYRFLKRKLPSPKSIHCKYGLDFLESTNYVKNNSSLYDKPPIKQPIPGICRTGELIEYETIPKLNDTEFLRFLSNILNVYVVIKITFNIIDPEARLFDGLIWVKKNKYSPLDIYNLEIKDTDFIDIDRCKVPINPGALEVFDKFLKLVTVSVETKGDQINKDLELTGKILVSVPYLDDFEITNKVTTERISREVVTLKGYQYFSNNLKCKFNF